MPEQVKYGLRWTAETSHLEIEMQMIRAGGHMVLSGQTFGEGLPYHYEQMRRILWPELDDHRWHRLCRDEILRPGGIVTVLAGCASSSKTHSAAWVHVCEYICFPEETCVLVSSIDIAGLKQRIWAEITMLWSKARKRFPDLIPGHLLDSKVAITTDSLSENEWEEDSVRDMRKGIFGVPCKIGGKWIGLSRYVGIKQKRMRLLGDEAQWMQEGFLSAFSNLSQNENFRGLIMGNFNDPLDPLGRAAEPKDGWASHIEVKKTTVWDTKFYDGRCVNLIGLDSPNFDFPADQPRRYKYLVSRESIAKVLTAHPEDSFEYLSQCVGSMKQGILERRFLTQDMCRKYGALKPVTWAGTNREKVAALDAAYGGDRCVLGHIEFGSDVSGKSVIAFHPPVIVPILIGQQYGLPEEQIAEYCKSYCAQYGISPENFFHDSTGRGTLGTFLSRIWSSQTNPVEFGGNPTERPVSLDIYIWDEARREKRLKKCSEHYSKFVTELWWSLRLAVESEQIRSLPECVMEDFCQRMWDKVKGDKYEAETKKEMKERVGRSPDFGDFACIAVEGARRLGFKISKLAADTEDGPDRRWIRDLRRRQEQTRQRHNLTYA